MDLFLNKVNRKIADRVLPLLDKNNFIIANTCWDRIPLPDQVVVDKQVVVNTFIKNNLLSRNYRQLKGLLNFIR